MREKRKARFSLQEIIGAGLLASITSVLAYVIIPLPFTPVPLTGQTFGVMLAAPILGAKTGALSMFIVLALGVVGVPVFSGGNAGPGILFGPTGGYLLSFPVAAFIIGKLCSYRGNKAGNISWLSLLVINIIGGILVIYTIGAAQLMYVTGVPLYAAVVGGVLPFIPVDLLKAAVAAIIGARLIKAKTFFGQGEMVR